MNAYSRLLRGAVPILLALGVSTCAEHEKPTTATEQQTVVATTAAPGSSAPVELERLNGSGRSATRQPQAEIFAGSGQLYNPIATGVKGVDTSATGDVSLNFVNTDVREVAKSVLGDLLGMNYLIDPSVQGTITIQTNQPLARKDVLPAFQTALRVNGLTLARQASGLYSIVPFAAAAHLGAISGPGYGTEIVQLHYVSPEQMRKVLEPIVPQGTIVQVDQARDLIVIGGSDGEREAIKENIATFDVDWMRGMSFALFTPRVATAKQLAEDLTHVMGDEGGPMAGQVRLIPIERMNAVLAIAPQTRMLEELRTWVGRLDQGNETTDRRIFVYYVQNGRAADLASALGKALGIRTSTSGSNESGRGNSGGASQTGNFMQSNSTGFGQSQGIGTSAGGFGASTGSPGSPFSSSGSMNGLTQNQARSGGNESAPANGENEQQGGLSITADEVNNALLIVATPSEYDVIEAALKKLDILPLQVLIEAAIAEVTLTKDLNFGVQWKFNNGTNNLTLSNGSSSALSSNFPGFNYVYTSGQRIQAVLSALQDMTHVDVLSAPKLMVLNNQTAVLQVGDQVPVATQSAVSTVTPGAPVVNSIDYKDTGVILSVTPRVNAGGLVLMDISQEVSDVTPTTSSSLNSPTINERKIGSTVAIQDGQTIALGGLITDNRTFGRSGMPFLQDIPVLGHLFGTDTNNDTRTELLVLITPRVVRNGLQAEAITEELREKMGGLADLADEMRAPKARARSPDPTSP